MNKITANVVKFGVILPAFLAGQVWAASALSERAERYRKQEIRCELALAKLESEQLCLEGGKLAKSNGGILAKEAKFNFQGCPMMFDSHPLASDQAVSRVMIGTIAPGTFSDSRNPDNSIQKRVKGCE